MLGAGDTVAPRPEVGERTARHGDRGRRDGRPHRPLAADRGALVERGHAADTIELYGSRRGQEATTWPSLEFPYTLLPGRGVRRSLRPGALWANAGALVGLAWACVRALGSFVARRPRVVVIVGGYASWPAGLAAVLTRSPLVSVNTDAVPGAVNGLLGRFAAANAVAFEGTDLPRAHVTGTPVRPELVSLERTPAGRARGRAALGLPADRRTVAGGGWLPGGPAHQPGRGRPRRGLVRLRRASRLSRHRPARLRGLRRFRWCRIRWRHVRWRRRPVAWSTRSWRSRIACPTCMQRPTCA